MEAAKVLLEAARVLLEAASKQLREDRAGIVGDSQCNSHRLEVLTAEGIVFLLSFYLGSGDQLKVPITTIEECGVFFAFIRGYLVKSIPRHLSWTLLSPQLIC